MRLPACSLRSIPARRAAVIIAAAVTCTPALGLLAGEAVITVDASHVRGSVSRFLTGACIEDVNHEIYGGLYSQMIFGEAFQEPAPAPALPGFKTFGGDWRVQGGELSIAAQDGPKLIADHVPAYGDAVGVEVFFEKAAGENAGLVVHVTKPGVGADNFDGYEVALNPANQTVRLARHHHNYALIQDAPCEVPVGKWIPLEVRVGGNTAIEVLVNGQRVLRHVEGKMLLPPGAVGLRAWHQEARFRRLWVKNPDPANSLPFVPAADVPVVSGMWHPLLQGAARGRFGLTTDRPFTGTQSQQIVFESGQGEVGIENQGLNRWGLGLEAGKPYEGWLWARAEKSSQVTLTLESREGARVYAETVVAVGSGDWQKLTFTLAPNATDPAARFAIKLKQPGAVTVGYVFLQPGDWGRFNGLPVRRDVTEALIKQGITVLRYGGSMVNHDAYKWKQMIGPRDRRPPYPGTWYAHSSNGWGIPDFMDLCEAAGFEYVPDFNLGETPQDMADFIAYAKDGADTEWGRRRAVDGHAQPYHLHYLELGNEERVNDDYFAKFKPLAEAIWARDPSIIPVVGDFFYHDAIRDPFHFTGGSVNTLAAHQKILELAKTHGTEVWFDIHVDTEAPPAPGLMEGPRSFIDQLEKLCPGAKFKVVIFELNAGNHAQRRALSNALAINAALRDGRFPIVTSANCLQPDGQNDNDWDQGLLFLNPAKVWLQPPGYITQMFSQNHQPEQVQCDASGGLDATATRSADGKTLILRVVNPSPNPVSTRVNLAGFAAQQPVARVTELQGGWNAVNTAGSPDLVKPAQSEWKHGFEEGRALRVFQPYSFTVIRFN